MAGRYWAVVPAAGLGRRMGAGIPKQYLELGGRAVVEYTLEVLCGAPRIEAVAVALAPGDPWWPAITPPPGATLITVTGGAERAGSVRNALEGLSGHAAEDDWVLVHDAARPCLRLEDLERLMDELGGDPVGGLLAAPVRDTMKRAAPDGTVESTEDRARLWHALTPQMFRYGPLRKALARAHERGVAVTDESAAMEQAGHRPRLVEGHAGNLKITGPGDLELAAFFLRQQERL